MTRQHRGQVPSPMAVCVAMTDGVRLVDEKRFEFSFERRGGGLGAVVVAGALAFGSACSGDGSEQPDSNNDTEGSAAAGGEGTSTGAGGGAGAAAGASGSGASGEGGDDGGASAAAGSAGSNNGGAGAAGPVDPSGLSFDELLVLAPLRASLQGSLTTWGDLTFVVPAGWTGTEYKDGVQLTSPDEVEQQCGIIILEPRAAAADEAALHEQLLQVVQELFPGYPNPMEIPLRRRGVSGMGFAFVGIQPYVGPSALSEPYLAIFGDVAVPVVPFGPSQAPCWALNAGIAARAEVFHSLTLAGFEPASPSLLAETATGVWFSSADPYSQLLVLSQSGVYGEQFGADISVPVSSTVVEESFASWTGDEGQYAVNYNVMSFFPSESSGSPHSILTRTYESALDGFPWERYLCQLDTSVVDGQNLPYEVCFSWVAD